MGDQDKLWAPHFCCGSCRSTLEGWLRGSRKSMSFAIPRIWREATNYHNDCYFCLMDISWYRKPSDQKKIFYPNIPSSIALVSHNLDLPIPKRPLMQGRSNHDLSSTSSEEDHTNFKDDVSCFSKTLHIVKEKELDDLVRDLSLTKAKAELFSSRLKE